jgi:hypothetical protein
MRKTAVIAVLCVLCGGICGCGKKPAVSQPESKAETVTDASGKIIDLDLTTMSSTMIYSTVSNMMMYPDSYMGQHIKLEGQFSVYHDKGGDKYIFSAIIPDATACCSQGIEFVLDGSYKYPDDYPEEGTTITVTGDFNVYDEYGFKYCQLLNAAMYVSEE